MGYLLLMTVAGSALFVGYLCWEKLLRKSMTQCMKYGTMMIVMLAYVLPWVWLKETYKHVMGLFWHEEVVDGAKGVIDVAAIETQEIMYRTKGYQLLMLIMLVWFVIAASLLLFRLVKSFRRTHGLHNLAIKCGDENLELTLKCLQESIRYKCKPEIVWTRADNATFTVGVVKPVIFLQKKYAEGDLYWILKHEIMHIVGKDLWVKLLLEFVCCLHWFNPLIYLLRHEVRYLSETSCDERVVKGCTEEECQAYIDLLDRNRGNNKPKIPLSSALGGGNEIDKRIALIKNRAEIRNGAKATVISVFVFLTFLNSLTALMYPEIHYVTSEVTNVGADSVDGDNFWIYDYAGDGYGTLLDTVLYDEQFVDKDGEIYPADFALAPDACSEHDIAIGVIQIHEKDSDGGCTLQTYEGSRCTECGAAWKGNFLYKAEKHVCPH